MTDPNKDFWPDFLIIGAGKSGTTSLDNYLKQHPQVFMAKKKEPNFFALEDMDPMERLANEYYSLSIASKEVYQNLFKDAPSDRLKGEISPMYLYFPGAAERIKKYVPDAKLIAILRHPVDRLYSRYLHLAREDATPTDSFADCLDRDSIWWQRPDLVTEGFYFKYLSKYYNLFQQDQLKVFTFEDLKRDSKELMSEICRFLGVDSVEAGSGFQYNKSGVKKSKLYDKTLGHNSMVKNFIKSSFPGFFKRIRQNTRLKKFVFTVQNYNLDTPKLDPELRKKIIDEVYKDDIQQLSILLNRDLSGWLT